MIKKQKQKRLNIKSGNIRLKTGDKVLVISGADKGKTGEIQKIRRQAHQILIPSVRMVKKHQKPTQENPKGSIVEIPSFLDASNLMYFCASCKKGTRIKIDRTDNKKMRICIRCNKNLDKK